ncbi:hypothetical protein TWF281_009400 [Arthrobotrys megalospora]
MPHILKLPNEIISLILDELGESVEWKLRLMATCHHLRTLVLPRFYSACSLEFGRAAVMSRAVLCDNSARHIWRSHQTHPEYGTFVKHLNVSFNIRFSVTGTMVDEKEDLEELEARSPRYVFGQLLPRFNTLKKARLTRTAGSRDIKFSGFYDTIRMVLSCGSLKELSISLIVHNSDVERWETEEQDTNYEGLLANLDTLMVEFREKRWFVRDQAKTAIPWLMGILLDLLGPPCRNLKSLDFRYKGELFNLSDTWNMLSDEQKILNETGRRLKLSRLEDLKLSVSDGGRWVFEQFVEIDPKNIRVLSLTGVNNGPLGEDLRLLQSFSGLSYLHLRYPPFNFHTLKDWITGILASSKMWPDLREAIVYGRFRLSRADLGDLMKPYGDSFDARIEEVQDQGVDRYFWAESIRIHLYPSRADREAMP